MRHQNQNFILLINLILMSCHALGKGLSIDLDSVGRGCPPGSISSALAEDVEGTSISVLFNSYSADVGIAGEPLALSQECGIVIHGFSEEPVQVALKKVEYRGFVALPKGGSLRLFTRQVVISDSEREFGPIENAEDLEGPVSRDFLAAGERMVTLWAECGKHFRIRSQSQFHLSSPTIGSQASFTMDSLDAQLSRRLRFGLVHRPCQAVEKTQR